MDDDLKKAEGIIRDLFDEYDGPVTRALSAQEVEQWDSLANVQFAVMLEQAFRIRFKSDEIGKFRNLGELLDAIARKRAGGK